VFVVFLAAAAAAAATPPKATPIDIGSWFTGDDYPAEAAQLGVQGDVRFEVDVDENGKATACRITQSSKSPILDKATCDIILAKAKFKPAMQQGRPVAGRYSNRTSWLLQGGARNGYLALTLDYSKDPAHPTCTVISKGLPAGPSCADTLQRFGADGERAHVPKLIFLMSFSTQGEQPYRGDPAWGPRAAFFAIDLYPVKGSLKPACVLVASEGPGIGGDPCAPYADGSALTDAEKRRPEARIEQSIFGLVLPASGQGRCKDGESDAEARSCV